MDDVEELRDRLARCRRLARGSVDKKDVQALTALAVEIEAELARVETGHGQDSSLSYGSRLIGPISSFSEVIQCDQANAVSYEIRDIDCE